MPRETIDTAMEVHGSINSKNKTLTNARAAKKDEFYTQLPDIERELKNYKEHFNAKVVYLNCDDPRVSNFFITFHITLKR